MNFSQMHERLRLELLRRIERNVLTAAWLAKQTGLRQPHISNFLHRKRRLSMPALDAVLSALHITTDDLNPAPPPVAMSIPAFIPLTESSAAIAHPQIPPTLVSEHVSLPRSMQQRLLKSNMPRRPGWERFVALTLSEEQTQPMQPILQPDCVVVLDRHDRRIPVNSLDARPPMCAITLSGQLIVRYVVLQGNALLLRPHALTFPVQSLPIAAGQTAADYIVGRLVAFTVLPP